MIVVDVETSGLNPAVNSILSIGAVDLANPERQFYQECQLLKGSKVSPEALAVNGFSTTQINDLTKKTLGEILYEFIGFVEKAEDRTLAGQNITFDRDFLNLACKRCKINYYFGLRTVDLHGLAFCTRLKLNFPPILKDGHSALGNDKILNFVGLPSEPKPHIAINGAKYEAEAFYRLIHSKPLLKEFEKYELPTYLIA